jgi:two-component system, cell cycle response regulator DivK
MKKLLVIEDTQDNFDLVADALGDLYEVHRAETGPEGITQATTIRPDLILLDMSLPGMDGWEVVRHLRAVAGTAGIPVIALTAHAMKGDRERCIEAGCTDYVAKPFNIKELIAMAEKYVAPTEDEAALSEQR